MTEYDDFDHVPDLDTYRVKCTPIHTHFIAAVRRAWEPIVYGLKRFQSLPALAGAIYWSSSDGRTFVECEAGDLKRLTRLAARINYDGPLVSKRRARSCFRNGYDLTTDWTESRRHAIAEDDRRWHEHQHRQAVQ
jgi:hypothetical protein